MIQVQNVNHNKTPRTVWAVMVGAARYVERFSGKLKAPNCILQFNPSKGFNAGSMDLVVSQRNGVGIAPHTPLLLNFGADFDIEAAKTLASRDA